MDKAFLQQGLAPTCRCAHCCCFPKSEKFCRGQMIQWRQKITKQILNLGTISLYWIWKPSRSIQAPISLNFQLISVRLFNLIDWIKSQPDDPRQICGNKCLSFIFADFIKYEMPGTIFWQALSLISFHRASEVTNAEIHLWSQGCLRENLRHCCLRKNIDIVDKCCVFPCFKSDT